MGVRGHIHWLHGAGVHAGVVHDGGDGGGRGVEVLHLLGVEAHVAAELRQLHRLLERRAGVRAHEVGEGELLEPQLLVRRVEALHELLVHARGRLAHHAQDLVAHMLGRQTQLPAHVVGGKLADEFVCVLVEQHVVEAYAAAHEDLLHTGQRAQLAQQLQIVSMGI